MRLLQRLILYFFPLYLTGMEQIIRSLFDTTIDILSYNITLSTVFAFVIYMIGIMHTKAKERIA
jgi:hypothetical protein